MPITDRMIDPRAGVRYNQQSVGIAAPVSAENHVIFVAKRDSYIRDVKFASAIVSAVGGGGMIVRVILSRSASGGGAFAEMLRVDIATNAGLILAALDAVSLITGVRRGAGGAFTPTIDASFTRNFGTGDALGLSLTAVAGATLPLRNVTQVEYSVLDGSPTPPIVDWGA